MPAFADVAVLLSDGGGRQSVSESGARENPFFGKNRFFAIGRIGLVQGGSCREKSRSTRKLFGTTDRPKLQSLGHSYLRKF